MTWLNDVVAKAEVIEGKLNAEALVTAINAELPKHTMPKAEYNSINKQLKTANDTIETLQKDNKDNEALQGQIKTHETTIATLKADHAKELVEINKAAAIKDLLTTSNAKYPDLLKDKFDLEKILVNDDGTTTGLTEQLESIKTNYADMFNTETKLGEETTPYKYKPALGGKQPGEPGKADFISIIHANQTRK